MAHVWKHFREIKTLTFLFTNKLALETVKSRRDPFRCTFEKCCRVVSCSKTANKICKPSFNNLSKLKICLCCSDDDSDHMNKFLNPFTQSFNFVCINTTVSQVWVLHWVESNKTVTWQWVNKWLYTELSLEWVIRWV